MIMNLPPFDSVPYLATNAISTSECSSSYYYIGGK